MLPFWDLMAFLLAVAKIKGSASFFYSTTGVDVFLWTQIGLAVLVGAIGVLSATSAAKFWNVKDPQRVVIDEVSGQHLTLLLGCALPIWGSAASVFPDFGLGLMTTHSALNWKYLLLGFILFRMFDIWKPFPARQAEALPGGWGIMADDWIAGIYAGLGLWIARALGL
jgi:phosphatidylglycerophosphatase A